MEEGGGRDELVEEEGSESSRPESIRDEKRASSEHNA